jgi:hypothetical protein
MYPVVFLKITHFKIVQWVHKLAATALLIGSLYKTMKTYIIVTTYFEAIGLYTWNKHVYILEVIVKLVLKPPELRIHDQGLDLEYSGSESVESRTRSFIMKKQ